MIAPAGATTLAQLDPHTRLLTQADLDWWLALAPTLKWRVAKTMPDWPHSYVVRKHTLEEDEFIRAARVIRTFGEPGKFFDRTNIYLNDAPTQLKWWTMGEPLHECQIINQAELDKVYGSQRNLVHTHSGHPIIYDGLATVYDDRYNNPACHAENHAIRKLLVSHFGAYAPRTLDVGCGTGLLLDLGITSQHIYTGVDPSQGMLNELIRKRPTVLHLIPATMEDLLDPPDGSQPPFGTGEFELVASLFGSASYLSPDTIAALPALSSDLLVLMHYKPGYLPDYWGSLRPDPDYVDASREAARQLPNARRFSLNNFEVTLVAH